MLSRNGPTFDWSGTLEKLTKAAKDVGKIDFDNSLFDDEAQAVWQRVVGSWRPGGPLYLDVKDVAKAKEDLLESMRTLLRSPDPVMLALFAGVAISLVCTLWSETLCPL
jgi:hypothetical protein